MEGKEFEDYGETGRLTHSYFPKAEIHGLISCELLSQHFTKHGASLSTETNSN